ncbi:siderophore-interacting protein [Pseudoclavibacter soli]|uniref:siderophore-interacting protein n=1 Tax=Pseudoclavibacter soli TaxID=452623 RepID=UPI000406A9F0|nr:siderophore-interacting protein [Pseudoclavibacter soli]
MSNTSITNAESGLVHAEVVRRELVTPHMVRVTLSGDDLRRFVFTGFDQWFRLAIPVRDDGSSLADLPDSFGIGGYLRYLRLPKQTRPVIRNYTVRSFRPATDAAALPELDIDFVVHGDQGIAGPWAAAAKPGDAVALIDQGHGWPDQRPADWVLLVADESGLPAVAGILRDLPRDAVGHAFIEVLDERDRQPTGAPRGVQVHWLARSGGEAPGSLALPAVQQLSFLPGRVSAFAVGEQALAAGVRRHLVRERDVPKGDVTFSGYWRVGRSAPS